MELSQIRLLVSDFPPMFRFYRDVLGLVPQVDDERGPYGKLSFPSGTAALALQTREHAAEGLGSLVAPFRSLAGAPRALLAVRVDDMDDAVRALRSRGAAFAREPEDRWGRLRVAYLGDPEGNVIELQEWRAMHGG